MLSDLKLSQQLLLISLIAWPSMLVSIIVLGHTWSEYNWIANTVSALASAVAPTRFAMNVIFTIEGSLLLLYGKKLNEYLFFPEDSVQVGHIIMTSGLLLISLVFFPGGMSMDVDVSTQGAHNAIAGLLYLSLIITPFVFFWKMRGYQVWHPSLRFIMAITGLKILTLIISVLGVLLDSNLINYAGLFQKTGILLDAVWSIFLSYQLVNLGLPE